MTDIVSKSPKHQLHRAKIHERVADSIRARILSGQWAYNAMLPGMKLLADEYGVATGSVYQALVTLSTEGLVRADKRRGTFVTYNHEESGYLETNSTDAAHAAPRPLVGIIAAHDVRAADDWTGLVLRNLESSIAHEGGDTTSVNRFQPDDLYLPMDVAYDRLKSQNVEALVLVCIYNQPEILEEYAKIALAFESTVIITWDDIAIPVPHVFYDNFYAGYQAAGHLLRQGCTRLAYVAPPSQEWTGQRLDGISRAMIQAGVPAETLYAKTVYEREGSPRADRESCLGITSDLKAKILDGTVDGIVAAQDYLAVLIMEGLTESGLKAGEDYYIIGFDDSPGSQSTGLTTMRPPLEELGSEAGRLIMRMLFGLSVSTQIRLRSHLIVRSSSQHKREPLSVP